MSRVGASVRLQAVTQPPNITTAGSTSPLSASSITAAQFSHPLPSNRNPSLPGSSTGSGRSATLLVQKFINSVSNSIGGYLGPLQKLKRSFIKDICSCNFYLVVSGLIVAITFGIAAYLALDIQKWTELKDYLEYCNNNAERLSGKAHSDCEKAMLKGLGPPPHVAIYLSKRASSLRRAIDTSTSVEVSQHPSPPFMKPPTELSLFYLVAIYFVLGPAAVFVCFYILIKLSSALLLKIQKLGLTGQGPSTWTLAKLFLLRIILLLVLFLPAYALYFSFQGVQQANEKAFSEFLEYCQSLPPGSVPESCLSSKHEASRSAVIMKSLAILAAVLGLVSSFISLIPTIRFYMTRDEAWRVDRMEGQEVELPPVLTYNFPEQREQSTCFAPLDTIARRSSFPDLTKTDI